MATCELNPACAKSFEELERRVTKLENDDWPKRLSDKLEAVQASVATLNGKLAGYVMVGTCLGAVISFMAAKLFK